MNRLPLDPRQSALAVRCGIRFFLSAALTGCELLSGAPLALGFLAAAGTGAPGLSALAGAVVGAFLFLDFSSALSYIATAVLIL
ncbi:MAG: stage II sporulation protein E, partial [Oscillospiraceae bacterium]|nr:stage II sporulation protein E [Oscillospiraceae bacterium]